MQENIPNTLPRVIRRVYDEKRKISFRLVQIDIHRCRVEVMTKKDAMGNESWGECLEDRYEFFKQETLLEVFNKIHPIKED